MLYLLKNFSCFCHNLFVHNEIMCEMKISWKMQLTWRNDFAWKMCYQMYHSNMSLITTALGHFVVNCTFNLT